MNWTLGIIAVVVLICILRQPAQTAPSAPKMIVDKLPPRSDLDYLEPLTAGGKAQEAGPTVNPTGQMTTMVTYDKL